MKKLLTIVVVALLLCLGISAALATTYSGSLEGYELDNLLADSTNAYALGGSEKITDVSIPTDVYEMLEETAHEKYVNAKITGLSAETGKYITTEVRVRMSTHNMYWKLIETASNNCEEGGKRVYKCTFPGCDATRVVEFPATAHIMTEVNTATCTEKGKVYDKCSVCGYYAKDKLGNPVYKKGTDGKVIETAALGHKASNKWATDVKCNPDTQRLTDGYVYNVCARCGKNIDDETKVEVKGGTDLDKQAIIAGKIDKWVFLNAHTFEAKPYKTYGPTCTRKGGSTYWCTNCGYMYDKDDDKQPALGHKWGVDKYTTCRLAYGDPDDVTWICTRCGDEAAVTNPTCEPKNDKNGNQIGYTYSAVIEDKTYTFDLVHDYSIVNDTWYEVEREGGFRYFETLDDVKKVNDKTIRESFCENGRKYTNAKCSVCGRYITTSAPVGHIWGEWEVVADKDEFGTTTSRFQRICEICGKLQVKVASGVPCGDNEHDWIPVDKTKLACGSLNAGTKLVCTKCGAEKTGEYFVEDHTWEEIAVVKAATCTEKGSHVVKCALCGAIEEQETAPIAHTLTKIEAAAATCAKVGNKEYYKCSVCEKLFSDAEGKTEVKLADVTIAIDPEAHEWDEGKITTEPTTDKAGVKTYTCKHDAKHTKTEEVAKLTPAAKYTLTALAYNGQSVTGKVVHEEGTKVVEGLTVRVTFFLDGNYYMATIGDVEADGTFSVDGVGPIEYISVVINGSSSVNPTDVVSYGSGEITVK
jgi:hypothetical protein